MSPAVGFLALWVLLAVYSILMAMDLGAGFLYAWGTWHHEADLVRVVDAYATPVWEAINTLLILFILGVEALFPKAINAYASILLIPVGLSFVLLSIRQVAFAVRHQDLGVSRNVMTTTFGLVGVLVPLPAMAFFTVLDGRGFHMVHGLPVFSWFGLLGNPITLWFMAEALVSELFLGATLIEWYAKLMQVAAAVRPARRLANLAGLLVLIVSPLTLWTVARTTPSLSQDMLAHWPWFAASALALVLSLAVRAGRAHQAWSLLFAGAMYLLGFMGYGVAQIPWLIRGTVTMAEASTNSAMGPIVVDVLILGLVFVVLPASGLVTWYLVTQAQKQYQT